MYERETDENGYYDPDAALASLSARQLARKGYHLARRGYPYARLGAERGYGLGEKAFERGLGLDFGKILSQSAITIGIYIMLSLVWRAYRGFGGPLMDIFSGERQRMLESPKEDLPLKKLKERLWVEYRYKHGGLDTAYSMPTEEQLRDWIQVTYPEDYAKLYEEANGEPGKLKLAAEYDPEKIGDVILIDYFIYVIMVIPILILLFNLYSHRREQRMLRSMR